MGEYYTFETEFSDLIHAMKYRHPGETYDDYSRRYADATSSSSKEYNRLYHYLKTKALLPAGRQQLNVGRNTQATAINCYVGPVIGDDTSAIFDAVKMGALTLRAGGGCGWDFSSLRPAGDPVRGLGHGAFSSGPVSFMHVWHSMCGTIMSAGSRRGAMMATLRCDHPSIMDFVRAKQIPGALTNFNISVMMTDAFMEALENDALYELQFGGRSYGTLRALDVWEEIMRSSFDWAEPGVFYLDRINRLNPLNYCEKIYTTNPCGEQPLPPHGACLLGSINITKVLHNREIDFEELEDVTDAAVRAFDSVIDSTSFPLPEQQVEAKAKRRMGVGVTGVANALEVMGHPYGTSGYLNHQDKILQTILTQAYRTSCELAKERGTFPLWDGKYCEGEFFKSRLPGDLQDEIRYNGLRNGLLTSIAPTGTISMTADNVSSGIEPVFSHRTNRTILTPEGKRQFEIEDYAYRFFGVRGRQAEEVTPEEHVNVLCRAQQWVDSSISKTINITGQIGGKGPGTTFEEFKNVYKMVWEKNGKAASVFNSTGKRMGILQALPEKKEPEGAACFFDPETGMKKCDG